MNQNCLTSNIVYGACLITENPRYHEKKYVGLCEPSFKKRYGAHKASFNHERYKNSTTLSNEFWKVKQSNPSVRWRIVAKKNSYTPESDKCPLCMYKKYMIANYPGKNLLNKRTEIISKCRHRRKFLLAFHGNDVTEV